MSAKYSIGYNMGIVRYFVILIGDHFHLPICHSSNYCSIAYPWYTAGPGL